ncbi:uncharacterized protein LOC111115869 isoform X1 [Crassostrea virginica]
MCWRMALFWTLCVILSWCPLPLGITITVYNHCLDSGALGPSDVTTLSPIGVQQCIKHCLRDRGCLSISYWRRDLKCAVQRVKAGGTINLVADPTCFYIERADLPTAMAAACATSSCQGHCTPLSQGGIFCDTSGTTTFPEETPATTTTTTTTTPTTTTPPPTTTTPTTTTPTPTTTPSPTCPSNYHWDPSIPFCHRITTYPKATWPEARTACQTVGADLAIIDVSAKFSKILNDPDRPSTSHKHWMGAVFNTTTNTYYWIDGRDVGATFTSTYDLDDGEADTCLYWYHHSPQTREKECTDRHYAYVCEFRAGLY